MAKLHSVGTLASKIPVDPWFLTYVRVHDVLTPIPINNANKILLTAEARSLPLIKALIMYYVW